MLSRPHPLPLEHFLFLPPCSPSLATPPLSVQWRESFGGGCGGGHSGQTFISDSDDRCGSTRLQQPVSLQVMPDAFRCHLAAGSPLPPQD